MKIVVYFQAVYQADWDKELFSDAFDHRVDDRGNLYINNKTRTIATYAEGIWKIVYTFTGEEE